MNTAITKGAIVTYTSKAGRTAAYRVVWIGPDKYNEGKTRFGLVAAFRNAKVFFVDSALCAEVYAQPALEAAPA